MQKRLLPELEIHDVTIRPDGLSAGWALLEELGMDRDRERARYEVLVYCAGYAAQVVAGEDIALARAGAAADFESAEDLCSFWQLEPLEEHIQRAIEAVQVPRNDIAIRRVAQELLRLETMLGETFEIVIDLADGGDTTEDEYSEYLERLRRRT